jgi:hypothetical protein
VSPHLSKIDSGLTSLKLLHKFLGRLLPVALWVVLSPAPKILASILKRALGTPAELSVGASGVGSEVEDVTSTTRGDFVGQIAANGGGERLDHFVDSAALTSSQIPGADAGVILAEVVESCEVTVG